MEDVNKLKPNLFIVGAAKAGTTALHSILSSHKEIYMSPIKEPNFFCKDISFEKFPLETRRRLSRNLKKKSDGTYNPCHDAFVRSREDYFDLFKGAEEYKIRGEASVSYLFSEVAAKEIYKFNPNAKIIILIRNPIERAYSHYLMDLKVGSNKNNKFITAVKEDFAKSDGIWGNDHLYVELGLYFEQIKRYFDIFLKKNILIIKYDSFKNDNKEVLETIAKFIEVSPFSIQQSAHQKNVAKIPKNRFSYLMIQSNYFKNFGKVLLKDTWLKRIKKALLTEKGIPPIAASDKFDLKMFFEEDIKRTQKLINQDLSGWLN